MSGAVNRQILLVNPPAGELKESDFRLVKASNPRPGDGQFLRRTLCLSLDPYMRGRNSASASYAQHVELNQVMVGGTVGRMVHSNHPQFKDGDLLLGCFGWQEYALSDGRGVRRIDPSMGPASYFLAMFAYSTLLHVGKPKEGESVVVSAAFGAVGLALGAFFGAAAGAGLGLWLGEARDTPFLLGVFAGPLAGSLLGVTLSRRLPVRFRRFSPSRGVVSVRFDNPAVAARVIAGLRERNPE